MDRRETFSTDADRATYLKLLYFLLPEAGVRLLGWCLMPNHVHLIAIPNEEESLAILLRRLHGRYAQYYNATAGRLGHLWQNRYFSCMLGPAHLVRALRYVDLNPVRAGLITTAQDYPWSSASAHVRGADHGGLLDVASWQELSLGSVWAAELRQCDENLAQYQELRRCTRAGRPYADPEFIGHMESEFGRRWKWVRPSIRSKTASAN